MSGNGESACESSDPSGQSLSQFLWNGVTGSISIPPWTECWSIAGLSPSIKFAGIQFIHLGGERHCESKVFHPRTQHCYHYLCLDCLPCPFLTSCCFYSSTSLYHHGGSCYNGSEISQT